MKFLFLLMFLVGCADNELRQFNNNDKQDPDCYRHFGAMPGYCDQMERRYIK